jgi:GTPase SAR1 family protein
MFGLIRNFYHWVKSKMERDVYIMLLGIDNAGKSSIATAFQGTFEETLPTSGYSPSNFKHENDNIKLYDIGGSKGFQRYWKEYFAAVHGCIFVVDGSTRDRLEIVKTVFEDNVNHPYLKGKPMLMFVSYYHVIVCIFL